jgi:Fe-S cluster assembly scaffold protein SufB
VELPLRSFRWITARAAAVFGRTLIVAEEFAEVALVDELARTTGRAGALERRGEIFAGEGAKVTYVALQRFGRGVCT